MNAVLSGSPVKVMSFAMLVVAVFAVTFATGSNCPPYTTAAKIDCPTAVKKNCAKMFGTTCPGDARTVKGGNFGTAPTSDKRYTKLGLTPGDDAVCYEEFSKCTRLGTGCIPDQATKINKGTLTQYVTNICP